MKKTILIIEDNKDIRESTSEILELAGFTVLSATDGKAGVEQAQTQLPDLILCDIMMPELDGYGVLYLLGKNPETVTIPFIFLTAKAERLDMRKGMEMGADDYLTKPFDDIELLNAIESRLLKAEQQKANFSTSMAAIEQLVKKNNGLAELERIIKERKTRPFKKKQIVYYEGDQATGIYIVLSGKIKTFKQTKDGRELLTGMSGPDDYLGVHTLLANDVYHDTAEVIEDASLCLLPKENIQELLDQYPDIGKEFIKLLANNLQDKEEQLLQLAYHSVRKRLSEVLLRLSKSESKNTDDPALNFKVSRENLAAMAGMATETVSRTLSDFKDEGLINKQGSNIEIINYTGLQRMKN
ncbi:MAG: response regulator [Sphingobacteriaceae bacterium]